MLDKLYASLLVGGLCALGTAAPVYAEDDEQPPAQEGVEVQARGPVHEAFATTAVANPQAMPVIDKQPPANIEEMPADQKPEGDNVQWISGYWAFDEERKDFLWISGLYRVPPPNM